VNRQLRSEFQSIYYKYLIQKLVERRLVFPILSKNLGTAFSAGWAVYPCDVFPDYLSIWIHKDFIESSLTTAAKVESPKYAGMDFSFPAFWVETRRLTSLNNRDRCYTPIGDREATELFERLHGVVYKLTRTLIGRTDAIPIDVFSRLKRVGEMIERTVREARIFAAEEKRMGKAVRKGLRERFSGL